MMARQRIGHFCALAPPPAAILRFLGKDQSPAANGWKFAGKNEYLGPIHAGARTRTNDTTQYVPGSPCADNAASSRRAGQGHGRRKAAAAARQSRRPEKSHQG